MTTLSVKEQLIRKFEIWISNLEFNEKKTGYPTEPTSWIAVNLEQARYLLKKMRGMEG